MVKSFQPVPSHGRSYRDAVQPPTMFSPASSAPQPMIEDSPLSPADEAFLQQQFPTRVTLAKDKCAASVAFWRFALIGKCLGHEVSSESVEKALLPQWAEVGEWDLFPLSYGFMVFRFSSQEARDSVLLGGPWIVDGAALALSPFDPDFRPTPGPATRVVMWVRLPNLPPAYWSDDLITDILSVAGRVVRLDENTRNRTKGRYARAAVELDLRLPLLPGVTIDVEGGAQASFWQSFKYENLHSFCSSCRRVGHRASACPSPPSPATLPSGTSLSSSSSSSTVDWADRLLVRRRRDYQRRSSAKSSIIPDPQPAPSSRRQVGPTEVGASQVMDDATLSPAFIQKSLPTSSSGPQLVEPVNGLSSPIPSTSAFLLKPIEPLGSNPSPQLCLQLASVEEADGGPVIASAIDESRRIQEIMDDNSDHDTHISMDEDVHFQMVGKKKKKGKALMTSICLRPAPRDRATMKRAKLVSSSTSGQFSLLSDLLNDASPADLIAKYGPPPEG